MVRGAWAAALCVLFAGAAGAAYGQEHPLAGPDYAEERFVHLLAMGSGFPADRGSGAGHLGISGYSAQMEAAQFPLPSGGMLSDLRVSMHGPEVPYNITVQVNGNDTDLRCAVAPDGLACGNASERVLVGAGDLVSLRMDAGAPDLRGGSVSATLLYSGPYVGVIRMGEITALSGSLSGFGVDVHHATALAAADMNRYLADRGMYVEIVSLESDSDPGTALERVKALNAMGIDVVLGCMGSSVSDNIRGYAADNGMTIVTSCSTSPLLKIDDNLYRMLPDDHNMAVLMADLLKARGIERVVMIYLDDNWGRGFYEALSGEHPGVSAKSVAYPPDAEDFDPYTQRLADAVREYKASHGARNVAVVMISLGEHVDVYESAMRHADVFGGMLWMGSVETKQQTVLDNPAVREFVEGLRYLGVTHPDYPLDASIRSAVDFEPKPTIQQDVLVERVRNHIVQNLGRDPITQYAYSAYDSAWIAGLASLRGGGSFGTAFEEAADAYAGAMGDVRLNRYGDLSVADYTVWSVEDGRWTFVGKQHGPTGVLLSEAELERLYRAVYMVDAAVEEYSVRGDAVFGPLQDPDGKYVDGELYVLAVDSQGKVLSHIRPHTISTNLGLAALPDGTSVFQKLRDAATPTGNWAVYEYGNPAAGDLPQLKLTWVRLHDGMLFGAGVYPTDMYR